MAPGKCCWMLCPGSLPRGQGRSAGAARAVRNSPGLVPAGPGAPPYALALFVAVRPGLGYPDTAGITPGLWWEGLCLPCVCVWCVGEGEGRGE